MDRAGLQQSLEQRARVLVVNAEHHVRHHLVELVAGELPATAPARLIRNVEAARRQHRDGDLRKQAQAELALKPREVGELCAVDAHRQDRSEEHTSELQSLMRISYAVFCLKKKTLNIIFTIHRHF